MRMKLARIKKIGNRIAEKYRMPHIIAERYHFTDGRPYVEVRSELTLDEGGNEFIDAIWEKLRYYVQAMGGCVYRVYQG